MQKSVPRLKVVFMRSNVLLYDWRDFTIALIGAVPYLVRLVSYETLVVCMSYKPNADCFKQDAYIN